MINLDKIQSYETWASIATTWASEVRTWAECQTIIDNTTRVSSTITNDEAENTNPIWSFQRFPWSESTPWQDTVVGITNISKP